MKVNILQFENATMQALHEKAATVANAQVPYGPFVGGWWEQYLSVVIAEAQLEQRVASSKDVAEIRGFYDRLSLDYDALEKERDALKEKLAALQEANAPIDEIRAPDVIRDEDGDPASDPARKINPFAD